MSPLVVAGDKLLNAVVFVPPLVPPRAIESTPFQLDDKANSRGLYSFTGFGYFISSR